MTKSLARNIKKKAKKKQRASRDSQPSVRESWVDRLSFVRVNEKPPIPPSSSEQTEEHDSHRDMANADNENGNQTNENDCNDQQQQQVTLERSLKRPDEFSIVSWNVLAEAYCSPSSHQNLPDQYQDVVFHKARRKLRILQVLRQLVGSLYEEENESQQHNNTVTGADIVCLQEVDRGEIGKELRCLGFEGIETPRVSNGGACGSRIDSCVVYARTSTFRICEHRILSLDDLATYDSSMAETDTHNTTNGSSKPVSSNPNSNWQGLQHSFLRRNMALLVRLEHIASGQTLLVANAHLYWNPGFEYVKLLQTHYILKQAKKFAFANEPVVFAGDLNSRPRGCAHSYLTHGRINGKLVAPWYAYHHYNIDVEIDYQAQFGDAKEKNKSNVGDNVSDGKNIVDIGDDVSKKLGNKLSSITLNDEQRTLGPVRYLLDATLNKLCRWFRIMGIDAGLETEEQERMRTKQGKFVVFDRCRQEQRTLITTSTRLMARRECPAGTYCINPSLLADLEVAMVHVLLTHGYVLDPENFLTRCVVCNGDICEVHEASEKCRILKSYEAPTDHVDEMEVYECNGCQQGYWWDDRPTSSASRVKSAATNLFVQCVRAGVPIKEGSSLGMFQDHVNVKEERDRGWDYSKGNKAAHDLLQQKLDFVDWLKDDNLTCPFEFRSAYASDSSGDGVSDSERIPFSNVTFHFVSTLDYIFFEPTRLHLEARLYVPTSFTELNDATGIERGGHLLPSDVWPSDHLAIGATFRFPQVHNQNQ